MTDKLLLEEAPASVFQPRLAAWIGLNESILLQHVHYLASKEGFGAVVDGVKWVRMTLEEWTEELPCFDPSTIRRTLENLEADSLLISKTFSGRSKWYRVNYELLQSIEGPLERLQTRTKAREKAIKARHKATVQNEQIGDTTVQNGHIQLFKMNSPSVQNEQLPRLFSENQLPKGNGGKKPPGIQEENRQRDGPRWELMNEFIALTGISIPEDRPGSRYWWSQIGVIYGTVKQDVKTGKDLMREAFERLGRENVYDPGSLVKTIRQAMAMKTNKPKVRLT